MGRAGPAAQFCMVDKVRTRPSQSDMLVPFSESPMEHYYPARGGLLIKAKIRLGLGQGGVGGCCPEVCRQINRGVPEATG